ncbi:MAG TPA: hypothetical protein VGN08_10580 [Solirubrobacteraceae bacterium]|jgi:hypothetical protein
MLFLIIPLVWLAIVAIVVAACRLVARTDANPTAPAPAPDEGAPVLSISGLTVWDCPDPVQLRSLADDLSAPGPGLTRPAARRPDGHLVRSPRVLRRHGTRSPART